MRAVVDEQRLTNALLREMAAGKGLESVAPKSSGILAQSPATACVGVAALTLCSASPARQSKQSTANTPEAKSLQAKVACPIVFKKGMSGVEFQSWREGQGPQLLRHDSWIPEGASHLIYAPKLRAWAGKSQYFWWTASPGGSRQLARYDFENLQAWAAIPFMLCSCSIFRLRRSHGLQFLMQAGIMTLICGGIRQRGWSDEYMEQVRVNTQGVIAMTESLGKLVPFFLGLFISVCLSRWWTMRSQYLQPIIAASVQLSFWLRATLPNEVAWVREKVEKDCLLGLKLVFLCAQGRQSQTYLDKLRAEGLLTGDEYHRLQERVDDLPEEARTNAGVFDFDLAALPFTWAAHRLYRVFVFGNSTNGQSLQKKINIPVPIIVKMLAACMDAKSCIAKVEMMLQSPLPFPYTHLVCLLVHLTAVITSAKVGLVLGTADRLSNAQICCEAFTVLAVNALYTGLLCLAAVLMDPFGDDLVDIPAALLHQRLWKSQLFTGLIDEDEGALESELLASLSGHKHHVHRSHVVAHEHDAEEPAEDGDEPG